MKKHSKIKNILFLPILALLAAQAAPMVASANQATSYTYAADEDKHWERTQDAYLPDKTITELELSSPEDLFIDEENMLYIADSGNRRIVKYDIRAGEVVGILEGNGLTSPRADLVVPAAALPH